MVKRILYVEDNPNNVLLVQRVLAAEGHQLMVARDAAAGWKTAVTQQPDLILMDLHLPGELNGLELTHRLKQHPALQHISVVALTAHDSAEVETAALIAGCSGFLRKPADLRQIRQTLHPFLNGTGTVVTTQTTASAYAFI